MTSQPIKSPPEKGAKSPEEENKCVCVWAVCIKCLIAACEWRQTVSRWVRTSLTLWIIGCSQSVLTSQWLSKKVKTEAEAVLAPRTRDRIRPEGSKMKKKKRHWSQSNRSSISSIFQVDAASLHVGIFLILSVGKVTADMKLKHIVGSLLKHSTDLTRRSRCICHTRSSRPVNRSITSPALAKHPWTVDRSFQKVSCDTSSDFFTGSLCKNHNSFLKILLKLRDNVCYLFFLLWSTLRRGICSNNWLHFGSGF